MAVKRIMTWKYLDGRMLQKKILRVIEPRRCKIENYPYGGNILLLVISGKTVCRQPFWGENN